MTGVQTRVLQRCSRSEAGILQGDTGRVVTRLLQGCYNVVALVLYECYRCVAGVLQEC